MHHFSPQDPTVMVAAPSTSISDEWSVREASPIPSSPTAAGRIGNVQAATKKIVKALCADGHRGRMAHDILRSIEEWWDIRRSQVPDSCGAFARVHRRDVAMLVSQGMRGKGKRREGLIPIDLAECRVR